MSARSVTPSSMTIGMSQSIRMPSRISDFSLWRMSLLRRRVTWADPRPSARPGVAGRLNACGSGGGSGPGDEGEEEVGGVFAAGVDGDGAVEQLGGAVPRVVVHERAAAGHGVLHVGQVLGGAGVDVVLAADVELDGVAGGHGQAGRPDLDVELVDLAGGGGVDLGGGGGGAGGVGEVVVGRAGGGAGPGP